MKNIKRTGRGIGKVVVALLAGILMPVMIWVALGAAVRQKTGRPHQVLVPALG